MSQLTAFQEAALKEYDALRSEIIARVVMRDQMINYSATMFAAVIGVGAHVGFEANKLATALILLAYPPVALVFAHGWAIHDHRIWQIGQFILHVLHRKLDDGLEWEKWLQEQRTGVAFRPGAPHQVQKSESKDDQPTGWDRRQNWFAIGAFAGTSAAALLLALVVTFFELGGPNATHLSSTERDVLCLFAAGDLFVGAMIVKQIWDRSGPKRRIIMPKQPESSKGASAQVP